MKPHDLAALAAVADKLAIRDVVANYCRGIDRLDLDLVRSTYHRDAIDHHTGFDGSIDEYIAWLEPRLPLFTGTHHLMGNHLAEIVGDRAVAETYLIATHWDVDDENRNLTTGIRYVDLMTRREGRWAVSERWAVREWGRSEARRFLPQGNEPAAHRDATDRVYRLREQLGLTSAVMS